MTLDNQDVEKGLGGRAVPSSQAPNLISGKESNGAKKPRETLTSCMRVLGSRLKPFKPHEPHNVHRPENGTSSDCGSVHPDGGEEDDTDDDGGDDTADNTIVRKIHEQPTGYPKLAAFMDSDENLMVFRRFGWLQTRILLDLQSELRVMERDLEDLEYQEAQNPATARKLRTERDVDKKKRLESIRLTWNAYCEVLANAKALTEMNKPTTFEERSLQTWLNNSKPIHESEREFAYCKEDLIILRPGREHAWLDDTVGRFLASFPWRIMRQLFQTKDSEVKNDGKDGLIIYARNRINMFIAFILTFTVLVLLVGPIWLLYVVSASTALTTARASILCIVILLVCTLVFSGIMSIFSRAQRHEILAASAAYCAVLVVFFGNLGQRLSGS